MFANEIACAPSDNNLEHLISLVITELTKVARWFRQTKWL
jgi:hypothetical protein